MGKCDSYTRILQMNPPYDYYLKVATAWRQLFLTSQFKFCRALCIFYQELCTASWETLHTFEELSAKPNWKYCSVLLIAIDKNCKYPNILCWLHWSWNKDDGLVALLAA